MAEFLKQIGLRLKGLREALELSEEEFAAPCNISIENYKAYEKGEKEMTLSTLKAISEQYKIDTTVLLFDNEPRMSSYFLTRKGKGLSVKRVETYKYQTLAGGFNNRKAEIFEVIVEPQVGDFPLHLSSHGGQEFNLILEGRMRIQIEGKELFLDEGDSIYYDSTKPHGMQPMDGKRVKFLAVIL